MPALLVWPCAALARGRWAAGHTAPALWPHLVAWRVRGEHHSAMPRSRLGLQVPTWHGGRGAQWSLPHAPALCSRLECCMRQQPPPSGPPRAWLSMRSSRESHPSTNRMCESICKPRQPSRAGQGRRRHRVQLVRAEKPPPKRSFARRLPQQAQGALRSQLPRLACRKNSSPSHSCCARARALQGPVASLAGSTTCRTCYAGRGGGGAREHNGPGTSPRRARWACHATP